MTQSNHVYCYGSYSCFKANIIANRYQYYIIYCYGLSSCAMIGSMYARGVYCSGELSCYGSNISTNILNCYGDQSCANTVAYIEDVFVGSTSGARNSIFYSTKSGTYHFDGPQSGDNTTIICGNDHACTIHCDNSGCNNLSLICDGSCNLIILCSDDAEKSDICPDGVIMTNNNTNSSYLPYLVPTPFDQVYENSVTLCYTPRTNAIQCDAYRQCRDTNSLDTTNIIAPICCTSYRACYTANDIKTEILLNSNMTIGNDIAIRCDGSNSCYTVDQIHAQNGGDIYLSGSYSSYKSIIETTQNYNIFCTAYHSCFSSSLKNANNTYCSGYRACKETLLFDMNNVWMYGNGTGDGSSITRLTGSLHCAGGHACFNAKVTTYGNLIQANGNKVLYQANVIATNQCHIFVIGNEALYSGVIASAKEVC